MIEAIKDLAVSYPFLPGSTVPDELKHIKDARIISSSLQRPTKGRQ